MRTLSFDEVELVAGGAMGEMVVTAPRIGGGLEPWLFGVDIDPYSGAGYYDGGAGYYDGGEVGATSGGGLSGHIDQHGSLIGCGLGGWSLAAAAVAGVAGPAGWALFAATAAGTVYTCGQVIIEQEEKRRR